MSGLPPADLARLAHQRRLVVAVDGPAGSGKSTVGRNLAHLLGCPLLDTGLMYRAVTLRAIERGVPASDGARLSSLARATTFEMDRASGSLLIDGREPEPGLRSPEVDAAVSAVSAHPEVRRLMVDRQRELARSGCLIMVGRDIATVVVPGAPVKLWVIASPEERARRRLAEDLHGPDLVTLDEMVRQIRARDALDSQRAVSPLRRAPGSTDINTERLTPEEALSEACVAIERALLAHSQPGETVSLGEGRGGVDRG